MTYCFDIDGVLCNNTHGQYELAVPYKSVIARVNALYEQGHRVILFTARGTTTGIDWRTLTEQQMHAWGVKYHQLFFGKPEADIFVDDRAMGPVTWQEIGLPAGPLDEQRRRESVRRNPGNKISPLSTSVKIFAAIPARGGSKGVPKKNIKLLAGYPLIAYSIAAGIMSRLIQRVIVSTDSPEIAEVARKYGAEVPFLRPAELAGDLSRDRDWVLHLLNWLKENEGSPPDYLVHLRPTTPLRDPAVIDDAVRAMLADAAATSLRSAHEAPETPFKWFTRGEQGYFQAFAHADAPPGFANWPRQMLPKVFIPDGYVDVLKTDYVLKAEEIHGDRMVGYISPACGEVDTPEDFDYLEFQVGRMSCKVLDFLRANYPEE